MLNRKTEDIEELLDAVREAYGKDAIEPYGEWDDPLSVGFRIHGVPATFSVIVGNQLPVRHYDVQIESFPPLELDYLFRDRAVSLWAFLDLIKLISGARSNWPEMPR